MAYKFWKTQPVPQLDGDGRGEEGQIRDFSHERIPTELTPLAEVYEWTTINLDDDEELKEVLEFLSDHYRNIPTADVRPHEVDSRSYRINFSANFLAWTLKKPGWKSDWHVGIRHSGSRKLLACIFAIPSIIRVHDKSIKAAEVNFLCTHGKFRCRRLVPVLIKELSRRCSRDGVYQALYATETYLPLPITTSKYFFRALSQKLLGNEISSLYWVPLPSTTTTPGLRSMRDEDLDSVYCLLNQYMARFEVTVELTKDCFRQTFLNEQTTNSERVLWAYVVEDPKTTSITDFISFFSAGRITYRSGQATAHEAYLYLYASEIAFAGDGGRLQHRLYALISDALFLAKKANFDVFSVLTSSDFRFFDKLEFERGGDLHFYLFNYNMPAIAYGNGLDIGIGNVSTVTASCPYLP